VLKLNNNIEPLVSDYIVKLSENNVGFAVIRKIDNLTMYVFYNLW